MPTIYPGRFTAVSDQPFVVFLIGMRINVWHRIDKWLPVATAMGPMIRTLMQHKEKGLLHVEYFTNLRGPILVQYWRSFEDLETFAKNPADPHLPAWKAFNRAVGSNGVVGIWHETYQITPGQYECVYGNMPRFGLGAAMTHVPATGTRQTARARLDASPRSAE